MYFEIYNVLTRDVYTSHEGFTLKGLNGLIVGYIEEEPQGTIFEVHPSRHIVELTRFQEQVAVLDHFASRRDVLKFLSTLESELPALPNYYDKLMKSQGMRTYSLEKYHPYQHQQHQQHHQNSPKYGVSDNFIPTDYSQLEHAILAQLSPLNFKQPSLKDMYEIMTKPLSETHVGYSPKGCELMLKAYEQGVFGAVYADQFDTGSGCNQPSTQQELQTEAYSKPQPGSPCTCSCDLSEQTRLSEMYHALNNGELTVEEVLKTVEKFTQNEEHQPFFMGYKYQTPYETLPTTMRAEELQALLKESLGLNVHVTDTNTNGVTESNPVEQPKANPTNPINAPKPTVATNNKPSKSNVEGKQNRGKRKYRDRRFSKKHSTKQGSGTSNRGKGRKENRGQRDGVKHPLAFKA